MNIITIPSAKKKKLHYSINMFLNIKKEAAFMNFFCFFYTKFLPQIQNLIFTRHE